MDFEAQVRERCAQRRDDVLEVGGDVRSLRLLMVDRTGCERGVDEVEIALVEHALEAFERQ
jgi:hypothetical protein